MFATPVELGEKHPMLFTCEEFTNKELSHPLDRVIVNQINNEVLALFNFTN